MIGPPWGATPAGSLAAEKYPVSAVISCLNSRSRKGLRSGGYPTCAAAGAESARASTANDACFNTKTCDRVIGSRKIAGCVTSTPRRDLASVVRSQIYPGHLPRLLDAEHAEHRRSDVAQRATST